METTLCENCEYSHAENAKRPAYRWMCSKFPRVEAANFVTSAERMSEPFMYCKDINGGKCPLFKKSKLNQIEMKMEE